MLKSVDCTENNHKKQLSTGTSSNTTILERFNSREDEYFTMTNLYQYSLYSHHGLQDQLSNHTTLDPPVHLIYLNLLLKMNSPRLSPRALCDYVRREFSYT